MSKEAKEFLKQNYCQNMGLRSDRNHRIDMYTSDMMQQFADQEVKKAVLKALEDFKKEVNCTVFPVGDNIKGVKVNFIIDKQIEKAVETYNSK